MALRIPLTGRGAKALGIDGCEPHTLEDDREKDR